MTAYDSSFTRPTFLMRMLRESLLWLSLFVTIAGVLNERRLYAQATFTPLGLFGGRSSKATDVSADGSVVVGTLRTASGLDMFHWREGEVLVRTESFSEPAVSADGSVVVGSYDTTGTSLQAFRWVPGAAFEGLGDLVGGGSTSAAVDASSDGSVVVGYGTTAGGDEAFRWTRQTGMIGLGDLPEGPTESVALGVSGDGNVIVGYGYLSDSPHEAFRWTADTGMVGLGRLPGGDQSQANAVSANGAVVVGYNTFLPSNSRLEAFRWTESEGMTSLGDLPGGFFASNALDVSADGSIIVGYGQDALLAQRATLWTAETGMISLQSVLTSAGVTNLDGWLLTEATGISPDGRTIVGVGDHNGVLEAWVATIPEPSTVMLCWCAAVGLIVFAAKRRLGRRIATA